MVPIRLHALFSPALALMEVSRGQTANFIECRERNTDCDTPTRAISKSPLSISSYIYIYISIFCHSCVGLRVFARLKGDRPRSGIEENRQIRGRILLSTGIYTRETLPRITGSRGADFVENASTVEYVLSRLFRSRYHRSQKSIGTRKRGNNRTSYRSRKRRAANHISLYRAVRTRGARREKLPLNGRA